MHSRQIIDKYDLPVIDFEPSHKLVLINVNRFETSGDENLYKQTRFAWRVNRQRVEAADYVLSVIRGVVKGAWVADFWKPATTENFPSLSYEEPSRHAFSGRERRTTSGIYMLERAVSGSRSMACAMFRTQFVTGRSDTPSQKHLIPNCATTRY